MHTKTGGLNTPETPWRTVDESDEGLGRGGGRRVSSSEEESIGSRTAGGEQGSLLEGLCADDVAAAGVGFAPELGVLPCVQSTRKPFKGSLLEGLSAGDGVAAGVGFSPELGVLVCVPPELGEVACVQST